VTPRAFLAIAAACTLVVAASTADAGKRKRKLIKPASAQSSKRIKHPAKHVKPAVGARSKGRAKAPSRQANMPDGWTWPPSKQMRAAGDACTAELDRLGVVWKPAAAEPKIATPITVPSMVFGGVAVLPTFRKPPFVMDCQLAHSLAVHGKELYARGVRELHFSRIHGYTQVRTGGQTKAALSRHALGLAIDVRAIVDDTGHKAMVLGDYLAGDALLLRVEDYLNDSGGFRMVLTPRNDPASHYDHFHVEARADYTTTRPHS
jgi:hypothetical protein